MPSPLDHYRQSAREALDKSSIASCEADTQDDIDSAVTEALAALTAAAEELVEQIIGEDADYRMHPDAKYLTGHPVEDKHLVDYILAETRGANGLRAKQRAALQSQRKQVEEDSK